MKNEEYAILYVEDDANNRVVTKHTLEEKFTVHIAASGEEALEICAEEPVAVLLADQRMPGLTGVDLAEIVRKRYPDIIRVIITAYSDNDDTVDAINRGEVRRFIRKPWAREELIAVLEDCVKEFRQNKEVRELQERIVDQYQAVTMGLLASSIGHDLRQAVTLIMPNVEIVQYDLEELKKCLRHEEGKLRVILRRMTDGLHDALAGVSTLHLMSQFMLQSLDQRTTTMSPVNLKNIVIGATGILKHSVIKRAHLDVDLPKKEITIQGNAGGLSQLLLNLISNASQAIPAGSPRHHRVSVRLLPSVETVVLQVSDTGLGIEPEHLEHIFKPFFTTKGRDGNGLGMTICQRVIKEHNGTIEVESQPGKGTTFTVILPRQQPDEEPKGEERKAP